MLTKEQEQLVSNKDDVKQLRRLLKAGELVEFSDGLKSLVRKATVDPPGRGGNNRGIFERYSGEEPVRTYAPILGRPWVLEQDHKGAVH